MNEYQKRYVHSLELELSDIIERKAEYQSKLKELALIESGIQSQIESFKKMCEALL